MNLEEAEQEINSLYKFWAITAPGVTPQEHGRLGQLWAHVDTLLASGEAND